MLNPMSEEQRVVFEHIQEGKNVVVDACAGSGKSTTILSIASELPEKSILQFTYNSMLRHEIKEKVRELGLENIKVHTYHSFAVKYYSSDAHTDTGIREALQNNCTPRDNIPKYDIIVLDECQDMTILYFQLVITMVRHMCENSDHKIQLLILGDYMQGLYEFKGADIRFLTCAPQCWKEFPYLLFQDFVCTTLKTSYRITNQMAHFVNRDMIGEDRIQACREGTPVVYIRRPRYLLEKIVVYNIKQLLDQGESPSDIFVLGGSVKGPNSPIRKMENKLTQNDIPCHVPMFETDAMDERVIEGKVVFSTFHTVKGRQRKYVFVVGFDSSYYFIARDIPRDQCPNTLYVGCTRATHGLFLLDNDSTTPLEFLKQNQHTMKQCNYIDFKGMPQTIFHEPPRDDTVELIPTYHVSPTELIKFLSEDLLQLISKKVHAMFLQENDEEEHEILEIPKVISTSQGYYEDVSDLNGIALPAYFFDQILPEQNKGQQSVRSLIKTSILDMRDDEHQYLRNKLERLPETCTSINQYLELANVYVAFQEKLYFKLKQIAPHEYSWIKSDLLDKCVQRFRTFLGNEFQDIEESKPEIEKSLLHYNQDDLQLPLEQALFPFFGHNMKFKFCARFDLLTQTHIYELKCTSNITLEHKLQVILYAWLWQTLHPENPRKVYIYNVKTHERLCLKENYEQMTFIVVELLKHKYCSRDSIEEEDFVTICRNVFSKSD